MMGVFMKQLKFALENIYKDIRGTLYLHIVVFVILVIGMAVPLWVSQMVWDLQRDAALSRYADADRLIVAEYTDIVDGEQAAQTEEYIASLSQIAPQKVGIGAFVGTMFFWENEEVFTNVQGCSKNFWKLNGYEVVEGKGPEEEWHGDKLPCYLVEGRSLYEKGIRTGDIIMMDEIEVQVAGIIRAPKLYGAAAMPYEDWKSVMGEKQAQYMVLFLFAEPVKSSAVRMALADKNVFNISQGPDQEQIYVDSVYAAVKERLLTGGMMLVFTIISLSAVISGMIEQEKHRTAVRLAIGADLRAVFRENTLRMECLLIFACMMDVLLYPMLFGTLPGMRRRLEMPVIIGIWLLYALLLSGVYIILWHKAFRKKQLAGVLKEGV